MEPKTKANKLCRRTRTFVLTCVGADGYPMTKAVLAGKRNQGLDSLFFCTNTSSNFVSAVQKNPKGNVYFYKRRLIVWRGCNLVGDFEVVQDLSIKKKYWNPLFKGAYPGEDKTHTNPDFCVLRFVPSKGRLYANYALNDFEV